MTDADDRVLQVGDELPEFRLRDDTGRMVRLRDACRESTVILFFYPKDDGLRCRTQACQLRDSWPLLRSEGIDVYGVNPGNGESHARFRQRYGLPFPLLVDEDLQLARAFGFVRGISVPGVPAVQLERSTAIIDPGGRVRGVLRNVKATAHFDLLRVDLGLPAAATD